MTIVRPEEPPPMPVLAYPGPRAPRLPRITVEVPDAWVAVPAEGDLVRTCGTGGSGDPVEVTVRHHAGPSGYAPEVLLDDLASAPAGVKDAEVERPFVVDIAGRRWHARNVSWDDDAGPVVEVHLVTALAADAASAEPVTPGESVTRFVHAVGRVRGAGLADDYDVLQSVLETLVVDLDHG
ncbi:MAG: hypothetical protein ACRCSN_04335 [Dermatophilaceae bacterium]